jgi:hypothetical protein
MWGDFGGADAVFKASFSTPRPKTKEQCKNGGWGTLGFKNQGDCVSFVATGGKEPAGPDQQLIAQLF